MVKGKETENHPVTGHSTPGTENVVRASPRFPTVPFAIIKLNRFRNTLLKCTFNGNEISDRPNIDVIEIYELYKEGRKDSIVIDRSSNTGQVIRVYLTGTHRYSLILLSLIIIIIIRMPAKPRID